MHQEVVVVQRQAMLLVLTHIVEKMVVVVEVALEQHLVQHQYLLVEII